MSSIGRPAYLLKWHNDDVSSSSYDAPAAAGAVCMILVSGTYISIALRNEKEAKADRESGLACAINRFARIAAAAAEIWREIIVLPRHITHAVNFVAQTAAAS